MQFHLQAWQDRKILSLVQASDTRQIYLVSKHWACEHPKTKTTYPTHQLRSQKNGTIVMVRHKPCKPYTDHLCITHVLSRISHNLVWIHLSQMPLADESQELNRIHQEMTIQHTRKTPELNQYNNSVTVTTQEFRDPLLHTQALVTKIR